MRRFLISIFVLAGLFINNTYSQHDSNFSLYEYAQMSFNPGYAGANNALCVTSVHRQQWMGFGEGRPQTTIFSFDMPITAFSSGAGFTILEDRIGFQSNLNLHLSYAYRAELDYGSLGVGIGLGLINRSIDGEWITGNFLWGGTIYEDPAIPHMGSSIDFDMSFGVYFDYEDFYAGFSATRLLQPKVSFDMEEESTLARHYYLIGGYSYELPNPVYDVLPSVLVQSDGSTIQFAINAKILYNKSFWGGVSYRYNDAIVPMLGIHLINGLSFGYSYDIVTSRIGSYNSGTHELMVRYCFNVAGGGAPGRYRSVRRL